MERQLYYHVVNGKGEVRVACDSLAWARRFRDWMDESLDFPDVDGKRFHVTDTQTGEIDPPGESHDHY